MNAMLDLARKENAACRKKWDVGGSDRYPAVVPARPRPGPEPKPVSTIPEDALIGMPAFDEALEHVNWCRSQGMGPQDVCASIKSPHLADTWGGAVEVLERHILKTRGRK